MCTHMHNSVCVYASNSKNIISIEIIINKC